MAKLKIAFKNKYILFIKIFNEDYFYLENSYNILCLSSGTITRWLTLTLLTIMYTNAINQYMKWRNVYVFSLLNLFDLPRVLSS